MKKTAAKDWFSFFAPRFLCLTLALGFIIRIILILHPMTVVDWGLADWLKIFFLGVINDVAFTAIALVPAFLIYTTFTDDKYGRRAGWIIWSLLMALTLYVVLCNDITDEYGGPLPRIVNGALITITACFSAKFFIPGIRAAWRLAAIYLTMMLYVILAVLIAFSEVVFWSEFGVRFNFIAVDYLVYTNEVVGNIMESYPMVPMTLAMLAIAGSIVWLMVRGKSLSGSGVASWGRWCISLIALGVASFAGGMFLHHGYRNFQSGDMFATQIHQNGCWDFLEAFASNKLDYRQFYPMLPEDEARALQQKMTGQNDRGWKFVPGDTDPEPRNVVLITIESLSAYFLARYGNEKGITPNIDSLLEKSLVFDRLYATGNRTVRGLEAVTLCIPPSSGESLVKRPEQGCWYSVGDIFRLYGYRTKFFYGGNSYFDNMGEFFGGCGYEIFDKASYDASAIAFSNIWGTSDEDTYREAIGQFDLMHSKGEPFFAHIMTISNHRPYTYPDGRIEYDGNPMSRSAAVKYTDWAIGYLFAEAAKRPWFSNTVFVVMADHCASSAGKTSLPVDRYHIPAFIYSPGFIKPQYVGKICSQIDVMPTLFGLLNIGYEAPFYGTNILAPDFRERAFMATYQDLGYYADDVLTVLSPVRKVKQFRVVPDGEWEFDEEVLSEPDEGLVREAEAYYQMSNLHYPRIYRAKPE